MKKICVGTLLVCSLSTSLPSQAFEHSDYVPVLTGHAAMLTDYIFRGISASNNGPAVQANFDLTFASKMYLGAWGSSVSIPDERDETAPMKMQIYAGYKDCYKGFSYDLGVMRYHFPRAHGLEYMEAYTHLAYSLLNAEIAFSNDVFHTGGVGEYGNIGFDWPIPERFAGGVPGFNFGANVGRYNFDKDLENSSYTDYRVFLHKTFTVITLGLDWTRTNKEFVGADHLDGDRVVFSVSASFA